METKLELKHLAPYLPYNLGIKFKLDDLEKIDVMAQLNEFNVLAGNSLDCIQIDEFKPILRPFDEFRDIKEITDEMTDWEIEIAGCEDCILGHINYKAVNLMFKHHIDVFGLIGEGAIDKNTLLES